MKNPERNPDSSFLTCDPLPTAFPTHKNFPPFYIVWIRGCTILDLPSGRDLLHFVRSPSRREWKGRLTLKW